MKKKACLLFAQVDHVSGEISGFAIERIMELGARNVQLIPSITKKNRPGNILIIDTDDKHEGALERFLARELKVSGYHRIGTLHIFHKVTFARRDLIINMAGKKRIIPCEIKIVGDPVDPLSLDVEHDALVKLQKALKTRKKELSLGELRTAIESRLQTSGRKIILDL